MLYFVLYFSSNIKLSFQNIHLHSYSVMYNVIIILISIMNMNTVIILKSINPYYMKTKYQQEYTPLVMI